MISKEFRVLFFLPYIFGILLASFYSYSLPVQQGKGGASAMYSLIIGVIYLIFQILYYLFYKVIYIRRLFRDLNR
ncbi:hypothetical protein [Clostridium sp. C8-1-8]|uniref:hypothetical protein n=1 Tax=Clostridium sp. C8-1-8 TaxID=2698831 RepID=UPI00137068FA|nr:hypothetical protein [Clostridium sp. C8-1-8]